MFFSAFTLILFIFVFAGAGGNISECYLEKFAVGIIILIVMLVLFVLINKNHIRKIKNNKKLFLFGIIPFLIIMALILSVFIMGFLSVFGISLDALEHLIINFFYWTLDVLFIYSVLIVLVGIYFISKKNKNIGYGFLKLGISALGAFLIVCGVMTMITTGPIDLMC